MAAFDTSVFEPPDEPQIDTSQFSAPEPQVDTSAFAAPQPQRNERAAQMGYSDPAPGTVNLDELNVTPFAQSATEVYEPAVDTSAFSAPDQPAVSVQDTGSSDDGGGFDTSGFQSPDVASRNDVFDQSFVQSIAQDQINTWDDPRIVSDTPFGPERPDRGIGGWFEDRGDDLRRATQPIRMEADPNNFGQNVLAGAANQILSPINVAAGAWNAFNAPREGLRQFAGAARDLSGVPDINPFEPITTRTNTVGQAGFGAGQELFRSFQQGGMESVGQRLGQAWQRGAELGYSDNPLKDLGTSAVMDPTNALGALSIAGRVATLADKGQDAGQALRILGAADTAFDYPFRAATGRVGTGPVVGGILGAMGGGLVGTTEDYQRRVQQLPPEWQTAATFSAPVVGMFLGALGGSVPLGAVGRAIGGRGTGQVAADAGQLVKPVGGVLRFAPEGAVAGVDGVRPARAGEFVRVDSRLATMGGAGNEADAMRSTYGIHQVIRSATGDDLTLTAPLLADLVTFAGKETPDRLASRVAKISAQGDKPGLGLSAELLSVPENQRGLGYISRALESKTRGMTREDRLDLFTRLINDDPDRFWGNVLGLTQTQIQKELGRGTPGIRTLTGQLAQLGRELPFNPDAQAAIAAKFKSMGKDGARLQTALNNYESTLARINNALDVSDWQKAVRDAKRVVEISRRAVAGLSDDAKPYAFDPALQRLNDNPILSAATLSKQAMSAFLLTTPGYFVRNFLYTAPLTAMRTLIPNGDLASLIPSRLKSDIDVRFGAGAFERRDPYLREMMTGEQGAVRSVDGVFQELGRYFGEKTPPLLRRPAQAALSAPGRTAIGAAAGFGFTDGDFGDRARNAAIVGATLGLGPGMRKFVPILRDDYWRTVNWGSMAKVNHDRLFVAERQAAYRSVGESPEAAARLANRDLVRKLSGKSGGWFEGGDLALLPAEMQDNLLKLAATTSPDEFLRRVSDNFTRRAARDGVRLNLVPDMSPVALLPEGAPQFGGRKFPQTTDPTGPVPTHPLDRQDPLTFYGGRNSVDMQATQPRPLAGSVTNVTNATNAVQIPVSGVNNRLTGLIPDDVIQVTKQARQEGYTPADRRALSDLLQRVRAAEGMAQGDYSAHSAAVKQAAGEKLTKYELDILEGRTVPGTDPEPRRVYENIIAILQAESGLTKAGNTRKFYNLAAIENLIRTGNTQRLAETESYLRGYLSFLDNYEVLRLPKGKARTVPVVTVPKGSVATPNDAAGLQAYLDAANQAAAVRQARMAAAVDDVSQSRVTDIIAARNWENPQAYQGQAVQGPLATPRYADDVVPPAVPEPVAPTQTATSFPITGPRYPDWANTPEAQALLERIGARIGGFSDDFHRTSTPIQFPDAEIADVARTLGRNQQEIIYWAKNAADHAKRAGTQAVPTPIRRTDRQPGNPFTRTDRGDLIPAEPVTPSRYTPWERQPDAVAPANREPWQMTRDEIVGANPRVSETARNWNEEAFFFGRPRATAITEPIHVGAVKEFGSIGKVRNEYAAARNAADKSSTLLVARLIDESGKPLASDLGKWAPVGEYRRGDLGIIAANRGDGAGTAFERYLLASGKRIGPSIGYSPEGLKTVQKAHRQLVEQALAEGKPVPPEVLRDYPDLTPPSPIRSEPTSPVPQGRGSSLPREGAETPVINRSKEVPYKGYRVQEISTANPGVESWQRVTVTIRNSKETPAVWDVVEGTHTRPGTVIQSGLTKKDARTAAETYLRDQFARRLEAQSKGSASPPGNAAALQSAAPATQVRKIQDYLRNPSLVPAYTPPTTIRGSEVVNRIPDPRPGFGARALHDATPEELAALNKDFYIVERSVPSRSGYRRLPGDGRIWMVITNESVPTQPLLRGANPDDPQLYTRFFAVSDSGEVRTFNPVDFNWDTQLLGVPRRSGGAGSPPGSAAALQSAAPVGVALGGQLDPDEDRRRMWMGLGAAGIAGFGAYRLFRGRAAASVDDILRAAGDDIARAAATPTPRPTLPPEMMSVTMARLTPIMDELELSTMRLTRLLDEVSRNKVTVQSMADEVTNSIANAAPRLGDNVPLKTYFAYQTPDGTWALANMNTKTKLRIGLSEFDARRQVEWRENMPPRGPLGSQKADELSEGVRLAMLDEGKNPDIGPIRRNPNDPLNNPKVQQELERRDALARELRTAQDEVLGEAAIPQDAARRIAAQMPDLSNPGWKTADGRPYFGSDVTWNGTAYVTPDGQAVTFTNSLARYFDPPRQQQFIEDYYTGAYNRIATWLRSTQGGVEGNRPTRMLDPKTIREIDARVRDQANREALQHARHVMFGYDDRSVGQLALDMISPYSYFAMQALTQGARFYAKHPGQYAVLLDGINRWEAETRHLPASMKWTVYLYTDADGNEVRLNPLAVLAGPAGAGLSLITARPEVPGRAKDWIEEIADRSGLGGLHFPLEAGRNAIGRATGLKGGLLPADPTETRYQTSQGRIVSHLSAMGGNPIEPEGWLMEALSGNKRVGIDDYYAGLALQTMVRNGEVTEQQARAAILSNKEGKPDELWQRARVDGYRIQELPQGGLARFAGAPALVYGADRRASDETNAAYKKVLEGPDGLGGTSKDIRGFLEANPAQGVRSSLNDDPRQLRLAQATDAYYTERDAIEAKYQAILEDLSQQWQDGKITGKWWSDMRGNYYEQRKAELDALKTRHPGADTDGTKFKALKETLETEKRANAWQPDPLTSFMRSVQPGGYKDPNEPLPVTPTRQAEAAQKALLSGYFDIRSDDPKYAKGDTVDYAAYKRDKDAYLAALTPEQRAYVLAETTKNQTEADRWYNAQIAPRMDQYFGMPEYTGGTPEQQARWKAADKVYGDASRKVYEANPTDGKTGDALNAIHTKAREAGIAALKAAGYTYDEYRIGQGYESQERKKAYASDDMRLLREFYGNSGPVTYTPPKARYSDNPSPEEAVKRDNAQTMYFDLSSTGANARSREAQVVAKFGAGVWNAVKATALKSDGTKTFGGSSAPVSNSGVGGQGRPYTSTARGGNTTTRSGGVARSSSTRTDWDTDPVAKGINGQDFTVRQFWQEQDLLRSRGQYNDAARQLNQNWDALLNAGVKLTGNKPTFRSDSQEAAWQERQAILEQYSRLRDRNAEAAAKFYRENADRLNALKAASEGRTYQPNTIFLPRESGPRRSGGGSIRVPRQPFAPRTSTFRQPATFETDLETQSLRNYFKGLQGVPSLAYIKRIRAKWNLGLPATLTDEQWLEQAKTLFTAQQAA